MWPLFFTTDCTESTDEEHGNYFSIAPPIDLGRM